MIKEKFVYTDYNGEERTEIHHFHMNKAEIMKMQMSTKGGMAELIQSIVDAKDVPGLLEVWDKLIDKSFGVKTLDGKFVKRPEDLEAFKSTEAYSILYMRLATDSEYAAKFINGIFPADLVAQAQAELPAATADN